MAADLHLGYPWGDTGYQRISRFYDWVWERKDTITSLVKTESYEMVWYNGWLDSPNSLAYKLLQRELLIARIIPVQEVVGNHFLNWQEYQRYFPGITFTESLALGGWYIEHGHRLDPMFYLQKPWYHPASWFRKWYFKTPFSTKLTENEDYPFFCEQIRWRYKQWASQKENPKKVIIGHTHSQDESQNFLTGVYVINLCSLPEDGVFAILDNGQLRFEQLP